MENKDPKRHRRNISDPLHDRRRTNYINYVIILIHKATAAYL